jgi:hypothetical protein
LARVDGSDEVDELIEARRGAGLPTLLDVGPTEVTEGDAAAGSGAVLSASVAQLAVRCGFASAPAGAVEKALRELGVRTFALPALLTRERAAALRRVPAALEPAAGARIGWCVGSAGEPAPSYVDAVAEGIAKVLADRVDVLVDVVGDDDRVPSAVRRHDRVSVIAAPPEPEILAGWGLHVWTPRIVDGEVADDLAALIDAAYAGVPSLMPLPARRAMDNVAADELAITRFEEPEAWAAALRRMLDRNPTDTKHALHARRWARSLHGPVAARAGINRMFGWLQYEVER